MNAEVGTRVEDSWLCTAKNARLGLCLTLRALDLLAEKPFELKYLKNGGGSSYPTPSCMKLLESISLPRHQWHDLTAPARLRFTVYTN